MPSVGLNSIDSMHTRMENSGWYSSLLGRDNVVALAIQYFPTGWKGALLGAGIGYVYGQVSKPKSNPCPDALAGLVIGGAIGGHTYGLPGVLGGMVLGVPLTMAVYQLVLAPCFFGK